MGTRTAQQCPPRSFEETLKIYFSMCRAMIPKIEQTCKFWKILLKTPLRNSVSVKSEIDRVMLLEQIAKQYQCRF